jgi:Rho-binding antiterminator
LSDGYHPISCISHERLEFAALKKQWLDITVLQGEHVGSHRLLPLDVYAQDGAEWLEARTESGEKLKLRLDWISF